MLSKIILSIGLIGFSVIGYTCTPGCNGGCCPIYHSSLHKTYDQHPGKALTNGKPASRVYF